jgi:hypothetical protein
MVREQSRRLSLCRLTFYRVEDNATMVTNGSFVRDAILPTQDGDQLPLWRETIRLDEGFYESLLQHPLPVREAAIREIAHRSMALDVYVWLAYRLHRITKQTPVGWKALFDQFGGGFHRLRDFRAKFREPLVSAGVDPYFSADVLAAARCDAGRVRVAAGVLNGDFAREHVARGSPTGFGGRLRTEFRRLG